MGILATRIDIHWNYFLAIERDLEVLSRYVEFDEKNFQCFSIEIARIILAAGAEVDVVCKQLCRLYNSASIAARINGYRREIVSSEPNIPYFTVLIPRFGLTLCPWDEWKAPTGVPFWWTAYNKIKHHRESDYHRANLKNALNAVSGLFVVVLYLYREKADYGRLSPASQLLRASPEHEGDSIHVGIPTYRF